MSDLLRALSDCRDDIVGAWLDVVMESYPADARGFFLQAADQFRNPVGGTLAAGVRELVDGLLAGADPAALRGPLDDILRIRAVQGLGPAAALGFVFELKRVVRTVLAEGGERDGIADELRQFETWVDALGLLGFDLYAAARERIWEIRNRDVMARTYSLLKRAGAVEESEEGGGRVGPGRRPVHLKGGQEE